MTSSFSHSHPHSHAQSSHLSRRASIAATAPYTIPHKQSQNNNSSAAGSYSTSATGTPLSPPPSHTAQHLHTPQHQQQHQHHQHHHSHSSQKNKDRDSTRMSSSVPVLSREFVVRRISEGESGRLKEELKCEACGKGYKHVSSLAKHLWEHTPEWNVTKKLLISKHQQVQLLEAASILVSMNDVVGSPKSSVDVPPTINEESIQFNPKYQDQSSSYVPTFSSPLNDTPNPAASLKMRMNSITQHPPSSMSMHPESSPARFEPGSVSNGGFLDVPKKDDTTSDKSSPKDGDDDDDDGIFGAMD